MKIALLCLLASTGWSASLTPALLEAKRSLIDLPAWHFQTDANESGLANGWATASFNDSKWPTLKATAAWQKQGFPDYHGSAWYRVTLEIPRAWQGSKVLLQSQSVASEYDVFVNGTLARHFGSREIPTADVPTQLDLAPHLRFGEKNVIALRVNDHGRDGGLDRVIQLRRVPPFDQHRALLPSPIFASRPDLVNLYWKTWTMAWEKVSFGNRRNGFVPAYMDEGYNEQIYQWDSIFMSMYGRYGRRLFPAMPTLDNFYRKQDPDGYIQRIYSETDGRKLLDPGDDYVVTNPPLFSWAEWDYARITGDDSRLAHVLPILEKYDAWVNEHQASRAVPGLYWTDGFDSGMDNMPRPNCHMSGWVDTSLEHALSAKYLSNIAGKLGRTARQKHWMRELETRAANVNRLAWNEQDGIYYDVDIAGRHTGVRHIGAFWSLLSGVANDRQTARLVEHLRDPAEFYRPHLFPALSASDASFTTAASYWAGGVWAPTNYMTIRGLEARGYADFAHQAALNHLNAMSAVYASNVDRDHVDPNEVDDDLQTIWECYNPDRVRPCTRADAFHFGRQDFAGWTGLGPVALLIEQLIGLEIVGSENRVTWHLRENGRVGLENFELGTNLVSLVAEPLGADGRVVHVTTKKPFRLIIETAGRLQSVRVSAGKTDLILKP